MAEKAREQAVRHRAYASAIRALPTREGEKVSDVLERLAGRNRGTTHWEGCEEAHVNCAAAQEIRNLRAELEAVRAELEEERARLDWLEQQPSRFAIVRNITGWSVGTLAHYEQPNPQFEASFNKAIDAARAEAAESEGGES